MTTPSKATRLIVVAPNVSEHMGGEAIKALQYIRFVKPRYENILLIAHERNRKETQTLLTDIDIEFIPDTLTEMLTWRLPLLQSLTDLIFFRSVSKFLKRRGIGDDEAVHYVSPISPVLSRFPPSGAKVWIGPINGNIHYPAGFRGEESRAARIKRQIHIPLQCCLKWLGRRPLGNAWVLNSGGERTRQSLRAAGVADENIRDVLDSGISEALLGRPRIAHSGTNEHFVIAGRLVPFKGHDLILSALKLTKHRICLDVFGRGETEPALRKRISELQLEDRVMITSTASHQELLDRLTVYRGFVLPSLAEANGIVVQEAMMLGLPVVALNWGGPAALLGDNAGILIEPRSREFVVQELAIAMDQLAADGILAEELSTRSRKIAEQKFVWKSVVDDWCRYF